MNKSLEELNSEETKILNKVASIEGTIEEKAEKIRKAGIYSEYRKVHKGYVELIRYGTESQKCEALKRALFIQWIAVCEPSFYTGIDYETDEFPNCGIVWEDAAFVFSELDSLISKNELDREIMAMLSYYKTWEFAFQFEPFLKFKSLQRFVRDNYQSNEDYVQKVREFNLVNRGQMGMYWLSLNL